MACQWYYLVVWKGYPDQNTWEPISSFLGGGEHFVMTFLFQRGFHTLARPGRMFDFGCGFPHPLEWCDDCHGTCLGGVPDGPGSFLGDEELDSEHSLGHSPARSCSSVYSSDEEIDRLTKCMIQERKAPGPPRRRIPGRAGPCVRIQLRNLRYHLRRRGQRVAPRREQRPDEPPRHRFDFVE
jgi:hypothetical protein